MPSIGVVEYASSSVRVSEGTVGGDTYFVDGKPLCFWWSRQHKDAVLALTDGQSWDVDDIVPDVVEKLIASQSLRVVLGPNTDEWGWLGAKVFDEEGVLIGEIGRRCSLGAGYGTDHLGSGRCGVHARDRVKRHGARKDMRRRAEMYKNDPNIGDLGREIGIQRMILDLAMDRLEEVEEEGLSEAIKDVLVIADTVGKQVDRATKIEQRYALTAGQITYLEATVRDILREYVDPNKLDVAVEDLRVRLGGQELSAKPKRLRA